MEIRRNGVLMTDFFNKPSSSTSDDQNKNELDTSNTSAKNTISRFVLKTDVQNAEILWALKCVNSHYSFNSSTGIDKLFMSMFPDSDIAKQFTCGEKKVSYISRFGLAPHFQNILFKCLEDLDHVVLLFDESLNQSMQKKQLDIYVRFWHKDLNAVYTRYFTSHYMGHSTAQDYFSCFLQSVTNLNLSKVIQLSMDGPAVNWALYDLLQEEIIKNYGTKTLNMGSCGLHILNNAFKSGSNATNWSICSVLTSLYWLFKDSPARREDFLLLSKTAKLPLKFAQHRWLENIPASERALEIWYDLCEYIRLVESGNIKMQNKPKSFFAVADATEDPLMPAKINFFLSVAKLLEPFMTFYQTDAPVLPFFASDILKLFQNCLTNYNILNRDSVKSLNSCLKICKFDYDNTNNHLPVASVSCGFIADGIIKKLKKSKKVDEKKILSFKIECRNFVLTMLKNIAYKCPANYSIVRNIVCMDPKLMATQPDICILKMKNVLSDLVHAGFMKEQKCERILLQFRQFLDNDVKSVVSEFINYSPHKTRLDEFFTVHMVKKECTDFFETVKILLILSHGQATVERGFSVNKKIEVENLLGESYIALRTICDHTRYCGGIENIQLTRELQISVSSARQKYMEHLVKEKEKRNTISTKRKDNEELGFLTSKRKKLEAKLEYFKNSIDQTAAEAKSLRSIDLFLKCEDMRESLKHTEKELQKTNKKISDNQRSIKSAP